LSSVAASLGVAASAEAVHAQTSSRVPPAAPRRGAAPAFRVAQITDTHVFHDLGCPDRMRAFLATFRKVVGTPDLVLHTGDIIYDALKADRDDVTKQWALWAELARELPSPPLYALGNHDVWGKGPASDEKYGKSWASDELKMPGRFYAATRGGWRFIVLDSTHPIPTGWYTAKIDDPQRDWLERELASTPKTMPIAIVSHIPLISGAVLQWATTEGDTFAFSQSLMHGDSHAIQAILRKHANVKLCLSGHLHLLDQVVYDGITYMGCGAVSGDWWKNHTFHQTRCGFATLNLFPDGRFERTYHAYDWPTASAAAL
jgi:3',5'-cyclic-AMP phosphodiesterase